MLRTAEGAVFTPSLARYVDTRRDHQPRRGDPKIYVQVAVGSPTSNMLAIPERPTPCWMSTLHAAWMPSATWASRESPWHGLLSGRLVRRETGCPPDEGRRWAFWVSPEWSFGCVLGYAGLLERIRMALDPARNRFHFGPLEG